MVKLKNLEDVKEYLDYLAKKPVDSFECEEYLPLEEFFFNGEKYNKIESDCRAFTFNEYMDGKISFEKMLNEIKKYGGSY